jgi:hypothetical protein
MISTVAKLDVEIGNKRVCEIYCDKDLPLGVLHDALMKAKGVVVEKMVAAQKEEELISKKMMAQVEEEQVHFCDKSMVEEEQVNFCDKSIAEEIKRVWRSNASS